MVLLGWALGKPLALLFDPFESVVSGALYTCTAIDNSTDYSSPRFCTFLVSVVPGVEASALIRMAVHTMGYVVADGKSNWLEGTILICT